ncbi:hypothetical protein A4U88_5215 [Serratia marcescens]|nr:hypothetical protein A4U88_5215 [Serratia marcescens]AXK25257.1 Hypothetical protein SmN45_3514 [Serratia marcescens]
MIIFSYLCDSFSYAEKNELTGWFFLGLILMTWFGWLTILIKRTRIL